MESIEDICKKIEVLWQEHEKIPYPAQCSGEVKGKDLALLDSLIAGCVSTFIGSNYNLNLWRTAVLGRCYRDATVVLPELSEEERVYFTRLETLADLVLRIVARKAYPEDL